MARNWTPEERRKQAAAIQKWQPWKQSTGPRSPEGKAAMGRNACKHGFRSRDMDEIRSLLRLQREFVKNMRISACLTRGPKPLKSSE